MVNKRTFNQTISIASSLLHLRFKRHKKTLLGILKTKSWKLNFFIYLKKKKIKKLFSLLCPGKFVVFIHDPFSAVPPKSERLCIRPVSTLLSFPSFWPFSPWTQDVNWTHIRHLEDVQNVFWTFYVRLIYVPHSGGWDIIH